MLVVLLQYAVKKLVLGMVNRLDDEPVVSREVEEAAALPGRAELG